jgi:hypothetical protein
VDCPTGITGAATRPWIVQNCLIYSNTPYTVAQTDAINSRVYNITLYENNNDLLLHIDGNTGIVIKILFDY